MDVLFQRGSASVADVLADIPDPPGYSAVRAMLRTLEEKGHVDHREEGRAYIYSARVKKGTAKRSALAHLLHTFFDGSTEQAMAALLELKRDSMSTRELERVAALVERAKQEGR